MDSHRAKRDRTGRRRLLALLAALPAASLARPALAAPAGPLGVLTGQVLIGPEEGSAWSGMMTNLYYSLTAGGGAGQGKFFYAVPGAGQIERASVEVQLGSETEDPISGAGLIFGVLPKAQRYVALMLHPGPSVKLWRFDGEGLENLGEAALGPIDLAGRERGPLKLGVVRREGGGLLLLDDQEIAAFDDPALLQGGAGIIALSPGRFAFQAFQMA